VYRSIYIHINHTIELHSILEESFSRVLSTTYSLFKGKQQAVDFDEHPELLNKVALDIISNNKHDIADNFILFLNEEKKQKKKIINQSIKVDEDIMKMI
jgi:hypothetical protein